jgi:hypothetical protein
MSAGLPGTGIAGVFYLAGALLMPVVELGRTVRGRSTLARWRLVLRQFTVACAILAGVWTTGWLLGLAAFAPSTAAALAAPGYAPTPQLVGESAMLMSLVTLVLLVGGVEVLSFVRRRSSPTRVLLPPPPSP